MRSEKAGTHQSNQFYDLYFEFIRKISLKNNSAFVIIILRTLKTNYCIRLPSFKGKRSPHQRLIY